MAITRLIQERIFAQRIVLLDLYSAKIDNIAFN